ncbi:MAG: hypothetical protein LBI05_08100 [Planctomycetaceae bacterium]|nr:hypothetical protein [Planctomycetaceae bacterium]
MMKYLHTGVPTTQEKKWSGYVPELGVHITDPADDPYGIEWLKFDANSPTDKAVQTKTHAAYQVDDIEAAVKGKKILLAPMSPMPGMRIAYIDHEGAVIELCQVG